MIVVVKVHLALGHTDMRKGLDGLATLIQEHLKKDPFSGHLFVFRGKNASRLKLLFWDGTGLCLFTKRMDHHALPRGAVRAFEGACATGCEQLVVFHRA